MKIKIKLLQIPSTTKLHFVKVIYKYNNVGFSLIDANNLVDDMLKHLNLWFNFDLKDGKYQDFEKELNENGIKVILSHGLEFQRNKKILDLGVATKEDYVDFISENIPSLDLDYKQIFSLLDDKSIKLLYDFIRKKFD